jgi:hypothetical protein
MDSGGGGFFFVNLVPQARKWNTIIPEDTLLKNRNSIEYSFVRTVDRQLMVCKKTQSKMNKMRENKNFY